MAFLTPFGFFAVLFVWMSVQANRDIAEGVAVQIAELNGAFCEQMVAAPGTERYAMCIAELTKLMERGRDIEDSSGLF